jgi:hypothetical protein
MLGVGRRLPTLLLPLSFVLVPHFLSLLLSFRTQVLDRSLQLFTLRPYFLLVLLMHRTQLLS